VPPNNAYDPAASSTSAHAFPPVFSNTYETCDLADPTASCTITGGRYTDAVSLAGYGPVSVELGAIQTQTANFDQFHEIDGVIGFTMGGKSNVFAALVSQGLCANVWALCLHEGSVSNGTLTVGGVDDRLASGPVTYVADSGSGFHSVNVHALILGPANVSTEAAWAKPAAVRLPTAAVGAGADVGSAILDTGTNILLLPAASVADLGAAMCADASLAQCEALW
jgi:hypothetical protein